MNEIVALFVVGYFCFKVGTRESLYMEPLNITLQKCVSW
jgi:hypothetical protein